MPRDDFVGSPRRFAPRDDNSLNMNENRNPSSYDAPELYDLLFDSLDFDISYWLEVARAAGFTRWEILGGFDGRPLNAADDQMIA